MKLSNRLQKIADFVPQNSIVGDIGTDHGYIPGYLIENNISKRVIGSDISKGSLDKIIQFIDKEEFKDKIFPRLGNGLEVIKPYEIDTVIIAGMGGLLIKEILENKKVADTITNFILQPMIASKELREYLIENNFIILKEELVKEDNKFYEIIFSKKGKSYVEKELDYEISPLLVKEKHPLLKEFIEFKINSTETILKDLEGIDSEKSLIRYNELSSRIIEYKEVLKDIES